jgi:hypothetical protein
MLERLKKDKIFLTGIITQLESKESIEQRKGIHRLAKRLHPKPLHSPKSKQFKQEKKTSASPPGIPLTVLPATLKVASELADKDIFLANTELRDLLIKKKKRKNLEEEPLTNELSHRATAIAAILKDYLKNNDSKKNIRRSKKRADLFIRAGNSSNTAGIATGEGVGTIAAILHWLTPWLGSANGVLLISIFQTMHKIFPPLSYFLYGIAAFILGIGKIWRLLYPIPNTSVAELPESNTLSAILSITAHLSVATLYILAGLMFLEIIATASTGLVLAAIGTTIGWMGHEVMDVWYAYKKYAQVKKTDFLISNTKENPKLEFEEKRKRAWLGLALIIGMALFALNGFVFSPTVPVLGVSAITAAGFACMIAYSSPAICDAIQWVGNKCNNFRKKKTLTPLEKPNVLHRSSSANILRASPLPESKKDFPHSTSYPDFSKLFKQPRSLSTDLPSPQPSSSAESASMSPSLRGSGSE